MSRLAGRVTRLERQAGPRQEANYCPACGLEHARKVSMEEVRSLIGPLSVPVSPDWPQLKVGPFCLCACCAEYRALAELTHR